MRAIKYFSWATFLFATTLLISPSYGQVSVGVQAGIDTDTDATLGGLVVRMPVSMVVVGLNFEYGSGSYDYASFGKRADDSIDFSVIRINVPISYPFAIGESGFTISPVIAPGNYSWNPDFDGWETENEFTLDLGATAQYNIVFVNGFFNVLGKEHGGPDWGIRGGVLFQLGGK